LTDRLKNLAFVHAEIRRWGSPITQGSQGERAVGFREMALSQPTVIAAVIATLITGAVGWIRQLPLAILIVLALVVGAIAYFVIRRIARYADSKSISVGIPVECGPNVKGNVVKTKGFTFYRARIQPSGNEQFPNLIARVHSIKRDGVEMHLDEVLRIKYHPGDGSAPCARKDDPAFLDVVYVTPEAVATLHVLFWPPGMENWNFESGHNYQLDVAILSDEISRRCEFEFVWTGDTDTSSCRLISDGSQKSPPLTECGRLKVSYEGDSLDCMWPVTFKSKGSQATWKGMIARLRVDSETKSNIWHVRL